MKVCVIGANGQIGKHLVDLLNESEEHTARAMVRKNEQVGFFENKGVETVVASLADSVEQIGKAITGCDAIVFTAGSGGSTGADQTLLIDLDGAGKTIEAAEKVGVNRFIMVSALSAHKREKWNEALRPYYAAKHYADKMLQQSNLTYTIIRPGGLLNEPANGKVSIANELDRGSIPRADVARTILESLSEKSTFNQSFDLISGDVLIADALKTIS